MSKFGWCMDNMHDKCVREREIFYIDPKTNKVVWTGEIAKCECDKRSCKCFVPAKDRGKKKTRKRKK